MGSKSPDHEYDGDRGRSNGRVISFGLAQKQKVIRTGPMYAATMLESHAAPTVLETVMDVSVTVMVERATMKAMAAG